uniref:Disease resistance RPP13-like protein 4 n=1 Tax=Anthurium amnicola TaxID=1678845 RepID=A0A1D1XTC8_9ARAE
MVDAVVSVLLEKLVGFLSEEGLIILEFQDQFKEMKRQLRLMLSFLKDADRMRRNVDTLRAITDELRELVYDAEDILAACSTAASGEQKKASGCCSIGVSPTEILFRSQTGRRLREINRKIKQIKEDMMPFLSPSLAIQSGSTDEFSNDVRRWSSPVFDQTQIVGLEGDADKIKGWLFGPSSSTSVVAIVGMGGLGKTTTAQKVFSDEQVRGHFEKMMWVSVSQRFRLEEIMRSMLKYLGDASIGDDQGELLNKIHQYLQGKRYLLVLDDVWSLKNGWWARLSDGLPKGNGSCVMITTRIEEEVARKMGAAEGRIHRPRLLSKVESWSLFCKIAFAGTGNVCLHPGLNEVGMEIVERCGGLPLAIKAVGGMMSCKPASVPEWRRIAGNFREELAGNDDLVMASLRLSYDELPTYLKPCLLCFAVYPEDCVILKDQLIHWWIGEGFVPAKSDGLLIEWGEDCFMGLSNRCLVETVDISYSGKVFTCKIHDMVRDLVTEIADEEAFFKLQDGPHRRLGLTGSVEEKQLNCNSKLRALISTANKREVNKVKLTAAGKICDCRNLRVLDLSESIFETCVKDYLNKLSSLLRLSYLNLRNIHPMTEIPRSLEKLQNLQILDVSFCHNLKTLPSFIVRLDKLIVLDFSCCGSLKYVPKGLGRLINLQVLKGFRPSRAGCAEGCRIGELKTLTQLKTLDLLISRGDEIARNEFDTISHLHKLQYLTISCFDSYGADLASKLEHLCLPQQLYELTLKFFPGEVTPNWLSPISLPELQYLSISHGSFTCFSAKFWGNGSAVWRLRGLMLESLPDLETDWARIHEAMPSLGLLSASWCPKLEGFPINEIGFNGGVWRKEELRA